MWIKSWLSAFSWWRYVSGLYGFMQFVSSASVAFWKYTFVIWWHQILYYYMIVTSDHTALHGVYLSNIKFMYFLPGLIVLGLLRYILCTQTPCKTCPNHVLRCFQLWNRTGSWTWGSSVHWDSRTRPCRSSFSCCCNCVALCFTLFLIVEFFLFFKSFIYSSIINDLQRGFWFKSIWFSFHSF